MNSTLLTTERPAGSPNNQREPEPTAEPARSATEASSLTYDPAAERRQVSAERREALLAAQQARAEYEALRAAYQSTPRLF